jgi:hypothetical protein
MMLSLWSMLVEPGAGWDNDIAKLILEWYYIFYRA